MKDFITALQFLTRIKIVQQTSWDKGSFARSVPWFSLVGAVIGLCLAGLNQLMLPHFEPLLRCVLLVLLEIWLTGGLLCDGLMDTADGVFSGRERGRMLEIMKDSRVGANGIMVFVSVVLLKVALYQALYGEMLALALFAMPIITRLAVVFAITHYKYARAEGTGGMFALGSEKSYAYFALFMAVLFVGVTFSPVIYFAALLCLLYCFLLANYLQKVLGGLTGDTYGFLAETGNVVFIFGVYIFFLLFNICGGGSLWLL